MTLFTFARRTAPFAFYALPTVALLAVVVSVVNGEAFWVSAFWVQFVLMLWMAFFLGTVKHLRSRVRERAGRYAYTIIHHVSTYDEDYAVYAHRYVPPPGLPCDTEAQDTVQDVCDDPLKYTNAWSS